MNKTICVKRILKDISDLKKNNLDTHNIYYYNNDDDIYKLKVLIIGTIDTPYQYGFYLFDITLPEDYPFTPPKVKFCTSNNKTRFNPNLYVCGKVCLSLINTWHGPKWTSCNSLTSLLLSLQAIVFIENPIQNEPGYETERGQKCINYNKILHYENINTSIMSIIKNIPNTFDCFENIIIENFIKNYNNILKFIEEQPQRKIIYDAKVYSMKQELDYSKLKKNIIELYECINQKK